METKKTAGKTAKEWDSYEDAWLSHLDGFWHLALNPNKETAEKVDEWIAEGKKLIHEVRMAKEEANKNKTEVTA